MKFILLNKKEGEMTLDTILKNHSGYNFVQNRKDIFLSMIINQGQEFWFRFWLTFCCHPEPLLILVERKFPDFVYCSYISLHQHFVEGSADEVVEFCFRKVFVKVQKHKKTSKKSLLAQLQSAIYNIVVFNFGVALCDIFYKWLVAKGAADDQVYWTMPEKYADKGFIPTPIELYISSYWNELLFGLLGGRKPRWLKVLLKNKCNENSDVTKVLNDISNYIEQKQKEIECADDE